MSELDRIYQEFYEQVTAKIWVDYEAFKKEKPYLTQEEQVKRFKTLLGKTDLSTKDFPELVPREIPGAVKESTILWLVSYFRDERNKYNHDPIFYFFQENEKRLLETFPTIKSIDDLKEILTKFFAQKEALANFKKEISIDNQDINKPLTIMSVKHTLSQWLANGENERVVEALQYIAERFGDKYFKDNATSIIGQFNGLKRDRKQGIISDEFYTIQLNRIRQALQSLIDEVPSDATLPDTTDVPPAPTPPLAPMQKPLASTTPPTDNPNPTQNPLKNLWIVGLGVLVGVTLLAALIPCPSDFLSGTTQVLMAMGAAMAATALPGLLNIDLPNVKTGSALAVLVLVYLFNPAKLVENNTRCNNEPFEFTINLQPDKNTAVSAQYPKLENATLQLWINNKWEDATVSSDNLADFKSIPGELKDKTVPIRFATNKYWKLLQDSVTLSGKSQVLTIAPDGLLGTVSGKVRSEQNATFLSGVEVEIEGVLDTTDTRGNFTIQIPLEKQKTRYLYSAQKPGYQTKTEPFEFDGEPIEIRLRKQ